VRLANPLAHPLGHRPAGAPGAGLGLVGLRERAELRGGRLVQRTEGSTFVLEAWLPWTA
jgi:signal transduction histidine kinase